MPKPKRRRFPVLPTLIVLLAALSGGGFYLSQKRDDAIPVTVEKVIRRDITEVVIANGRLQPASQVLISPEVAGEIVELPVLEGQRVKKGDLLVQIKPDNYKAARNSSEASYQFALGMVKQAEAELELQAAEFRRNSELSRTKLIADKQMQDAKVALDLATLRLANAKHQVDQARFARDRADDDLSKTKIVAPMDGTIVRLRSQLGERVLGTSFNMGTEIMTLADLDAMEARVDVSEIDVVLIAVGQHVRLEVDAFKDRKFTGTVSAIANASRGSAGLGSSSGGSSSNLGGSSSSGDAPKFDVRIRITEKEAFRPGMSVTAEIETRSRKNVLSVPIQSVTTRLARGGAKPGEVVFIQNGDRVTEKRVKSGISDKDYFEIEDGVTEGQMVVSGGYKAISRDLEDGKKVRVEAGKSESK
jgi:HlyD family secretion protein